MLQQIRERAQGVIAWFIVILISVPFALWGIQSYLGGGGEQVMAKVNGDEITVRQFDNAYRDFRQSLRQQLGDKYRPDLIDEKVLRQEVLDRMIRNTLIRQAADEMGLRAGDDMVRRAILQVPEFQVGGQFNQAAYERALRIQGLSPSAFEAQLRQTLVTEQLQSAIRDSAIALDSEADALVRLRQQKRDVQFITLPVSLFEDAAKITDEEIAKYYQNNQSRFVAPERVKVRYLELDVDNIAKTLKTDDETLRGYYAKNKANYIGPEQRRASHILFTVDEGASSEEDAKARKLAEETLLKINQGADFAALAKELSQDPGSAEQGGDLGFFEKGIMDPAFEKAVFSMKVGEVSEPVRTSFGYHLIRLDEVRAPEGKAFDEVKDEVKSHYLKGEAEKKFYEYAEKLSNLAYEAPDSLEPAAQELGLEIKVSDWITREGNTGLFAAPKLVTAAFSDDVLLERQNSEAVELAPEHIVVLRVDQHEEASQKSLDMVKDEIRQILIKEQAAKRAGAKGKELLAKLRAGSDLGAVASEYQQAVVSQKGLDRDNREVPPEVVAEAFRSAYPKDGKPSYTLAQSGSGDISLIRVDRVIPGEPKDAEQLGGLDNIKRALERSRGEVEYRRLVQSLRSSAKIEILEKP